MFFCLCLIAQEEWINTRERRGVLRKERKGQERQFSTSFSPFSPTPLFYFSLSALLVLPSFLPSPRSLKARFSSLPLPHSVRAFPWLEKHAPSWEGGDGGGRGDNGGKAEPAADEEREKGVTDGIGVHRCYGAGGCRQRQPGTGKCVWRDKGEQVCPTRN